MHIDESWDLFYEYRTAIAVLGVNRLVLPMVQGKELEYIQYAAVRMSVGGAKPLSLGVMIGSIYHYFETDLAPANFEVISAKLELTLSEGMQFQGLFDAMAGAETMEMFVHGFRKRIE